MDTELAALLFNLTTLTARADALAATHVRDTGRHAWHARLVHYLVECGNGLRLLGIVPAAPAVDSLKTSTKTK
jgi:hypothetical protein